MLRAIPSVAAVVAVPACEAVAMAAEPEHRDAKVRRLAKELSAALDDYGDGRWSAEVYPASRGRDGKGALPVLLVDIEAAEEAQHFIRPELTALLDAHRNARTEITVAMQDVRTGTQFGISEAHTGMT
jgi:hypothetical protein